LTAVAIEIVVIAQLTDNIINHLFFTHKP